MTGTKTLIFYHGDCPDGFGGAYAAWKKFGDDAEYIGLKHGKPFEHEVSGADVYFIDFCYPKEAMDDLVSKAASLTVLDHHEGMKEVIESMPKFVYDANRSGASIAWAYFHPGVPLPELLTYIEDDDLFRFSLPNTRPVLSYLTVRSFTFPEWNDLAKKLDDPDCRESVLADARTYAEYFVLLAEYAAHEAKLVMFEGYEVYFAVAHPMTTMKSLVGNLLASKQGPFALVVSAHPEGYGVSIRGDGSVDVAKIAQKYGGNGHPKSAGFRVGLDAPMPWKLVEETEQK